VIISAHWLGSHVKKSATGHNARCDRVLHVMNVKGRSRCISIDGDHRQSVVRASGLKLGPLGRWGPRSDKDLREVKVSEW